MPCDATPTAADWAAARSRIRDDVLVLRTERFDESAALLDAVAGDAGAPRLRDLARLRYRCAADNRRDGDPGRRCAATAGVALVAGSRKAGSRRSRKSVKAAGLGGIWEFYKFGNLEI